ncbi:MAG: MarR family transcriptional regulator [Actinomycetota bacterium]
MSNSAAADAQSTTPVGTYTDVVGESAAVDFTNPLDREQALRIGRAWTEMRRGASMSGIRDYIYGTDHPLGQGQMDALDLLARRDRTMRGLAERLRVDPSTATRAVQSLVAGGLAERYPSPDDGRVVMVRMTDDGRGVHAAADARRSHIMAQLLGEFSPEERSDLAGMLERFVAAMDRVSQRVG